MWYILKERGVPLSLFVLPYPLYDAIGNANKPAPRMAMSRFYKR